MELKQISDIRRMVPVKKLSNSTVNINTILHQRIIMQSLSQARVDLQQSEVAWCDAKQIHTRRNFFIRVSIKWQMEIHGALVGQSML